MIAIINTRSILETLFQFDTVFPGKGVTGKGEKVDAKSMKTYFHLPDHHDRKRKYYTEISADWLRVKQQPVVTIVVVIVVVQCL